ncbi:MAG: Rho termination factor N-terminal domain-containing protein [Solirubrobacteraceae bacterium]|nr:Rho termination factor N-terminal domain-containing protein [Solirubrobacteraceae bacterium]
MSVFSRDALEGSPLADLHAIASELGIEGYRRMRKADLVKAIIIDQGGDPGPDPEPEPVDEDAGDEAAEKPARSRSRRSGSSSSRSGGREGGSSRGGSSSRSEGGRSGGRGGSRSERGSDGSETEVEGTIEVLGNGSAFVRVKPPGQSDDDVYVSAAQVRRCELKSGDKVAGPARPARRSERYPSLVRVVTINGSSADEVSVGTPFDKLEAGFPTQKIGFSSRSSTLKSIASSAPFGRGSRVSVVGPFASGRSTTLRMLAAELAAIEDVELSVVLAGARPEERAEWVAAGIEPAAFETLTASADSQAKAIDRAIESARKVTAKGGHSAVVIDSIDDLDAHAARKVLGAARNVPGAGSLTVIAASREPVGGETTLIYLASQDGGKIGDPAVDKAKSKTLRSNLLS